MTVFNDLLEIKEHRENAAEAEERRCGHRLEEAAVAQQRALAALADYRAWSARRERELYEAVIGRLVGLRDLEDLKQTVLALRDRERVLEQEAKDAEVVRAKAAQMFADAKAVHARAIVQKQKFVELAAVYLDELRVERERAEDRESEEFRAPERFADDEAADDEAA